MFKIGEHNYTKRADSLFKLLTIQNICFVLMVASTIEQSFKDIPVLEVVQSCKTHFTTTWRVENKACMSGVPLRISEQVA